MPFNLYYGYQPSRQCSFWHTCKYTERSKEIDFITLIYCRFIFVHSIQQWLVPGNTYCLKIIITHVDNARAFNITKIIRWMITSFIIHIILMLSRKDKCFFFMEGHNLTLLQLSSLSLISILCYIQILAPNL